MVTVSSGEKERKLDEPKPTREPDAPLPKNVVVVVVPTAPPPLAPPLRRVLRLERSGAACTARSSAALHQLCSRSQLRCNPKQK